jgi:hypothetical protein
MRRVFLWLYVATALIVVLGVLLQAFSIAAFVRGAGEEALEMHKTVGFITHSDVGCLLGDLAAALASVSPAGGRDVPVIHDRRHR